MRHVCALAVLIVVGCTKRSDPLPAPVLAPGVGTTPTEQSGSAKPRARAAALKDWRDVSPDAALRQKTPAVVRSAEASADGGVLSDAALAANKAARARARAESAVNRTLNAARPRLTACFSQNAPTRVGVSQADVEIRVHRSGYVMRSTVSGVPAEVSNCIDGVLRQLHVTGVETDSISVKRSFRVQTTKR
ncbi:MAG: hypothetical protein H6707_16315 [Deltaproteobacteria bacterium]|nr:hypothetical protein [Deltaproteobacteria bacterium]